MPDKVEFPSYPEPEAKKMLRGVLEDFPLYRTLKFSSHDIYRLPEILNLHCGRQICSSNRLFELVSAEPVMKIRRGIAPEPIPAHYGFTHSTYACRNCRAYTYNFLVAWEFDDGKNSVMKCGQYPAQEVMIDPILSKHLGKIDSEFLTKGQRCRMFSFGVAAISYLRRVVEDRMSELLDMLKEEKISAWTPEELDEFSAAKTSWQFSRKLEYAAQLLPQYLRPGGDNPLALLHDLASDGLHNKSEDECIEIFDRCIAVLTYVFRELELHRSGAADYKAAIKLLNRSSI